MNDTFEMIFYDFGVVEEAPGLAAFNETLKDEAEGPGARMADELEFRTVYNYIRRYSSTFQTVACEMKMTITPVMDDVYNRDQEMIIEEFGRILHTSLRKSDTIMQKNNSFYMILPDMSDQNKMVVIDRIRKKMQLAGLYNVVIMSVDTLMIGPDMEQETWFKVAM